MNDWSMLKKLIWLRIIKGGGSAVRTVKGAIVHVINALARPAISVKCEVNPIQDLHGYDSPWPAGGGRNKFNLAEAQNNKWINNTTGEIESVSGFWITGFIPVKSGDVIRSAPKGSARNAWYNADKSQATYFAFNGEGRATAPSDGFVVLTVSSSTVAYGSDFIVTINDADLTFSPYSNICPISGRTSATVTRTGKNLCSVSTVENLAWGVDNTSLLAVVNSLKDGTYTVSFKSTLTSLNSGMESERWVTGFTWTNSGGNFSHQIFTDAPHPVGTTVSGSKTLTIDSTTRGKFTHAYCYGAGNNGVGAIGTGTLSEIQIELGSTASAYEPYQGNTYTIQLGDTVYGGTLDVTGGKMVVTHKFETYNGTENWDIVSSRAYLVLWNQTPSVGNNDLSQIANWLVGGGNAYARFGKYRVQSNGAVCVGNTLSDNTFKWATAQEFKAYLADNPLSICYAIAEPFEITLTPTQIEMLLGENNLWADAGDSTLTYYADGNASTSEALGILLGGTYNNPGGADDVSDDEALGILLGGS